MRLFASAGEELEAASMQGARSLIWQARAAQAFHWAGEHHRSMRLLRRQGRASFSQALGLSSAELQEMLYPLGAMQRLATSDFNDLDPLLVGALIMAESDWNPRAFSRVGARGLMQLMPDTGRRVAESLGVAVSSDEQLFDPSLNLKLGVTYLGELSRRFEGRLPLVLASYNAGEDQVSKWWSKRAGDDIEEFIANIPFRETRRYVQRVYGYYAEYQRIYRTRRVNLQEAQMPLVIGLMSGTSADGVDAALVRIEDRARGIRVHVHAFSTYPFPSGMREAILTASDPRTGTVDLLCRLNVALGEVFKEAALEVSRRVGIPIGEVDLIGSHGQTVQHLPEPFLLSGHRICATLQLGEPSVIAERTGVMTVADFRPRDMAAGGEGAPLAPPRALSAVRCCAVPAHRPQYRRYQQRHRSTGRRRASGGAGL